MTRKEAAANATKHRQKVAKEKIENAIRILMLEHRNVNPHSVAKTSGVSRTTATKYLKSMQQESLFNLF